MQLNGCCVNVLVTAFKETILAECSSMIKQDETQSKFLSFLDLINIVHSYDYFLSWKELRLMFRLMDRVSDGIAPMLKCLEDHIVHAGLADMMVAAELITQVF